MSYITAIGTANPVHQFAQAQLADFMVRAMQAGGNDARRIHALFKASGIDTRYSVLDDYGRENDYNFYPRTYNFEPFPTTAQRQQIFRREALPLSTKAVNNALQQVPHLTPESITHLVVVSCTGMYAPGLDIELVQALRLSHTVQRTCINFMGCYAAFNGLKLADAFCKSSQAKVLVVCTEICSIHFQKQLTPDNMLANALFADGAAAVIVETETQQTRRLRPVLFCNDVVTDGAQDMAWHIGDTGFEMKLSTYVAQAVTTGVDALLKKNIIAMADYYAIHPGGKKILAAVEQALGITAQQNHYAYEVLRHYGNMSSPTVLFVLAAIFKTLTKNDNNKTILSMAFGPGITLESALLEIDIRD